MNLYLVEAKDDILMYSGGEVDPPEYGRFVALVRAETRSKAQYTAWSTESFKSGSQGYALQAWYESLGEVRWRTRHRRRR